jgi:hypothetical protein
MPGDFDDTVGSDFGPEWERRQRAAYRDAQEEIEEAVEGARDRGRDLGDVALEAMHRGDSVMVRVGERTFSGQIGHVGAEFLTVVDGAGNHVDVAFGALSYYTVTEPALEGGQALAATFPSTFRDCFFDPEATGAEVEVGGSALAPVSGQVAVLGQDHVVMRARGRGEWVVPLAAVGYLIRR